MVTNNGKRGGNLVGKPHKDKQGRDVGGIKAVVTDAGNKPVELEGGEVIINKEASKKHWKELSRINQSAGNGVPINKPVDPHDEDPQEYSKGGKIEFNPNRLPNKWILNYAQKIKDEHPEIWKLGGNIYGNQAFQNLKRVSDRGYWLDSEEWFYIKWRSFVARHQGDFRIAGVVAMLKWVDKVDRGWQYMKNLIEEEIAKREKRKSPAKMSKGGKLTEGEDVSAKSESKNLGKVVLYEYQHNRSKALKGASGIRSKGGIVIAYSLHVNDKKVLEITSDYISQVAERYRFAGKKPPYSPKLKGALEFFAKYGYELPIDAKKNYGDRFNDLEIAPNVFYTKGTGHTLSEYYNTQKPFISEELLQKGNNGMKMSKGGELKKGIKTELEHQQTIEKYKKKNVSVEDVAKSIAKDHLKEDPRYYSKLAKMEGKMADGGSINPEESRKPSDFGKVLSSSSRFRPYETIFFNPPLLGKNNAKLVSYTWAYEWTEKTNWEGEAVGVRVSDWGNAEMSSETGRNIVHKYGVELPNGEYRVVSSESIPVVLGFVDKEQKKVFGNLATASKTLAQQQLKLAILEAQIKELDDAKQAIIQKGFPEVVVEQRVELDRFILKMGDAWVVIESDGKYDQERMKTLQDSYIRNRLSEMGLKPYPPYTYDLKVRIERQKKKIEQILKTQNMASGGEISEPSMFEEGGLVGISKPTEGRNQRFYGKVKILNKSKMIIIGKRWNILKHFKELDNLLRSFGFELDYGIAQKTKSKYILYKGSLKGITIFGEIRLSDHSPAKDRPRYIMEDEHDIYNVVSVGKVYEFGNQSIDFDIRSVEDFELAKKFIIQNFSKTKATTFQSGGQVSWKDKSIKSYLEAEGFQILKGGVVKYGEVEFILWMQRKYTTNRGEKYMVEVGSPDQPNKPEDYGLKIAVLDSIKNLGEQKKGNASFVLDKIIEASDQTGTILQLFPQKQGNKGLSNKQLTDWYISRGFEIVDDENIMQRTPKHSVNQNTMFAKGGQTESQKAKIAKVMGEFKRGTLKTSYGEKVTDYDQAIAIALSEAGASKYAKGGKVGLDDTLLIYYHEKQGNIRFAKNTIYLWLYDDMEAATKLQSGEYDYVFFPLATRYESFRSDYVPPLKRIWTKKYQNQHRGSNRLIGVIEAWFDEASQKLYIMMMTTKKSYRRKGVMSGMIKNLREYLNVNQEDVIFDSPTKEGSKVMESKKYSTGGLIAPNGKPSNLTPEQYKLVRTKAFKDWFGDWENDPKNASKVVDENGEPRIMYHGTPYGQFNEFERTTIGTNYKDQPFGFYFTNIKKPTTLKGYSAEEYALKKGLGNKPHVYEVFLNIKNPIIQNVQSERPAQAIDWEHVELRNQIRRSVVDFLQKGSQKIDGVIAESTRTSEVIAVALQSKQIKLADGTNTTFDGNNSDIRFESGGEVGVKNDDEAVVKYSKLFVKNGVDYFPSCIGHKNWSYTYRYKGTFSQINQYNFYENTCALFEVCEQPNRNPDYVSSSGSKYWYENNGVIRQSNHWGRIIASCSWFLSTDITNSEVIGSNNFATGFCKFKDFLYLHLKDRWNIEKMDKYIISMFNEIKPKFAKGGRTIAQTPAPISERIKGSKVNPKGSSQSGESAKNISFSQSTIDAITEKVEQHNRTNPDKKVTLAVAKAVVRRGMGAYSASHRPTIGGGKPNSRVAWGLARLNAFTYKVVHGKSKSGKYSQDDDLLDELGIKHQKFENGGKVKYNIYREFNEYADKAEVDKLINDGIVELKMYDTTNEHSKLYGFDAQKPLYIQSIIVAKEHRNKGIGSKVMEYINDYAKKNEHDLIFGRITQKAEPNIDVIKSMMVKSGFNTCEGNNDFYKKIYAKGGLLAPNGKPTNLTPEQYKLVRTKAFKDWFGDWENDPENASKVVDENGEPMICYHGTFREFNVFEWSKDGGFYFTEFSRIAEMYATSVQEGKLTKTPNENPIVLKCFLNFRNPLRERIYGIVGKNKRLINIAIKKGYDSLIISGGQDLGGYYDQYVAIHPNQIKLADGTNTTFDANNPDIRFEQGGEVQALGFTERELEDWKEKNRVKQRAVQNPIVSESARKLSQGEISQEQYLEIVKKQNPIYSFKEVPKLPTLKEIVGSLTSNKIQTGIIGFTKFLDDNQYVASRLDIPAYYDYDVWVVSVHDGTKEGQAIGYGQTAYLKDVTFKTSPKTALRIATGIANKSTFARMFGYWINKEPNEVREMAVKYLNDPNWIQVGMNPYRHSWFYDKEDGMPLVKADYVIQVGALVLAKNAVKTSPSDPMFAVDKSNPDIKFQKGGQTSNLIAPNGRVSNLDAKQYKLVRTPEFKAWFGDWENDPENASKVVDENGEPLVVYRGMSTKKRLGNVFEYNVNMFGNTGMSGRQTNKFAFYFTDNRYVAKDYADRFSYGTSKPVVKQYFLKSNNPFEAYIYKNQFQISFKELYDHANKSGEEILVPDWEIGESKMVKFIERSRYARRLSAGWKYNEDVISLNRGEEPYKNDVFYYFVDWDEKDSNQEFWKTYLKELLKYDGVVFYEDTFAIREYKDGRPIFLYDRLPKTYCVWDSNQIKLADGSNTTFDADNPDVRFEDGGAIENDTLQLNDLANLDVKINKDNWRLYHQYVVSGGELNPQDYIALRHTIESYFKELKKPIEAEFDSNPKAENAFEKWKSATSKLNSEKHDVLNSLRLVNNLYGLSGDLNAKETYHFTTPSSLLSILEQNQIYGEGETSGVSTTTNAYFDHPELTQVKWYGVGNKPYTFADLGVRIDLDLDRLRNDGYRIRKGSESIGTFEGEEELRIGGWEGIKDASRYINSIQVDRKIVGDDVFQEIVDAANKLNIKVVEKTDYDLPVWKVKNPEKTFTEYQQAKRTGENPQLVNAVEALVMAEGFHGGKLSFDIGGVMDYTDYHTSIVAITNKKGEILILQRGSTAPWMPNKWSLVGGGVDEGENPTQAAIRESKEEVGLFIKNPKLVKSIKTKDVGTLHFFKANYPFRTKISLDYENQEYKWVGKHNYKEYEYVPYVRNFMEIVLGSG